MTLLLLLKNAQSGMQYMQAATFNAIVSVAYGPTQTNQTTGTFGVTATAFTGPTFISKIGSFVVTATQSTQNFIQKSSSFVVSATTKYGPTQVAKIFNFAINVLTSSAILQQSLHQTFSFVIDTIETVTYGRFYKKTLSMAIAIVTSVTKTRAKIFTMAINASVTTSRQITKILILPIEIVPSVGKFLAKNILYGISTIWNTTTRYIPIPPIVYKKIIVGGGGSSVTTNLRNLPTTLQPRPIPTISEPTFREGLAVTPTSTTFPKKIGTITGS